MYARNPVLVLSLLLPVFSLGNVAAMFMRPTFAPVERMVKNIQAYIDENPEDANGYFHLARANYLAFVNRSFHVPRVQDSEGLPRVAADHILGNWLDDQVHREATQRALKETGVAEMSELKEEAARQKFYENLDRIDASLRKEGWQPDQAEPEEALGRAAASLAAFDMAIQLQPENSVYHLGRASLMEQIEAFVKKFPEAAVPEQLMAITDELVCKSYLQAYKLSIADDLKMEMLPLGGLRDVVSHEAGAAYLRMCADTPAELKTTMSSNIEKLSNLRVGVMTPIVISLDRVGSISELIGEQSVAFDFDADGRAELWRWLKPNAGLLVWQAEPQQPIESGAQLFGSFTFNMLWQDGFEAMRVLDDNRDGWLADGELRGIALWFDRNANGVSESNEITQLSELGITRLVTKPNAIDHGMLMNNRGAETASGEALPLWDWLAEPSY